MGISMSNAMQWKRDGDYAQRCEPWTICAISAGDGYSFELWHDKQPDALGSFPSPGLAKAEAKRLESEGVA